MTLIAIPSAGTFLHASVLLNRMPIIGHCENPANISYSLSEMNRVLDLGGTLVVGTPDYGSMAWRVIEWFYQGLLPYARADQHLTHYTRYRLTEALARAGFAILGYRYIAGGELIVRCVKREEIAAEGFAVESETANDRRMSDE